MQEAQGEELVEGIRVRERGERLHVRVHDCVGDDVCEHSEKRRGQYDQWLYDGGAPVYDRRHAEAFAALGVPAFARTPDRFPSLMAAAIQRQDLAMWAARNDVVAQR